VAEVASPGKRLVKLEAPEVSSTLMTAAAIGDMEKPIALEVLTQGFTHEEAERETGRGAPIGFVAAFVVLIGLALAWRYSPLAHVVSPESVVELAQAFARNWWAPLVLMAAYTPASLVMFPRPLITLAAVMAFGPWEGLTYAMTGVILAGIFGYALGRLFHRDTARRLAGPRLGRVTALVKRRGIVAVALVRVVPIAPYLVVNVVMGAMRIRFVDFVVGTFLGMLPGALAATVLSDQFAAALQDPARVNGWLVALAGCAFAGLAFFGHRVLLRLEGQRMAL
jgi:uncharacterized membrane protein YdjX (TVP38/TMEM64 family)